MYISVVFIINNDLELIKLLSGINSLQYVSGTGL